MKILVALYDRATEAYAPVMTVHTRGEAIRTFRTECNKADSPLSQHPTDYELWQLAEYDDQNGEIYPNPDLLARAEDHKS